MRTGTFEPTPRAGEPPGALAEHEKWPCFSLRRVVIAGPGESGQSTAHCAGLGAGIGEIHVRP